MKTILLLASLALLLIVPAEATAYPAPDPIRVKVALALASTPNLDAIDPATATWLNRMRGATPTGAVEPQGQVVPVVVPAYPPGTVIYRMGSLPSNFVPPGPTTYHAPALYR